MRKRGGSAGGGARTGLVLAAAAVWLVAAFDRSATAAQPTIISINACTDQLLIALADPGQILGITRYARDRSQSAYAERAAGLPLVSGTAEEVLAARPDIVLAGGFTRRATRDFIRSHGLRLVEYDSARSLDEARQQIAEIGALVGHPDRAEAAIRAIDAAIGRARDAARRRPTSVLPLQRRGWVAGGDTLVTSMIEAVGLRNAGRAFGPGRQVGLEEIVALRPDVLLLTGSGRAEDQGSALLHHPALAALYPPQARLVVQDRLTFCGGPRLADAIDALAIEVARLPR